MYNWAAATVEIYEPCSQWCTALGTEEPWDSSTKAWLEPSGPGPHLHEDVHGRRGGGKNLSMVSRELCATLTHLSW